MNRLDGKICLVTGAAKGIGRAICETFFAENAEKIIMVDWDIEGARMAASEMDPNGARVYAYKCNVADYYDTERVLQEILAEHGRVDVLVNNAGVNRDRTLIKMTKEEWDTVIGVDLNSLFYVCKQICPGMKERKYGKIVNMSSVAYMGSHGQTNYSAAKAGVLGFTRSLAKELAKYNITVNAVCPAAVNTDMLKSVEPELLAEKMKAFPRKRPAEPGEVASVVLFLSTDDSCFVNGEKILVTDARMTS